MVDHQQKPDGTSGPDKSNQKEFQEWNPAQTQIGKGEGIAKTDKGKDGEIEKCFQLKSTQCQADKRAQDSDRCERNLSGIFTKEVFQVPQVVDSGKIIDGDGSKENDAKHINI